MAILSNINDKFAVDSTGAIQFSGQAGTSGYVLKSNGNTAPTWVDASTVIGGPYLPLSGGTLTGATATASGISFTVGGTAQFDGDMTLPAAADNFDIGFNLQTTGKIRFGHTSWNNSIGLESYWMVMRSNQNEGYKFIDSAGNTYVQFNASNNASGAYNSTFAGTITSGALTVGTSGTSRFTDTNAFPLQLNRGLAVDVVGTAGTIFGLGTYSTGTTYIDAVRIIGVLDANGTDGDMLLQVLNSGTHTTALTLNNDTNATFAGNVGIGETNPTYKFEVRGSGTNTLQRWTTTEGGALLLIPSNDAANPDWTFIAGTDEDIQIDPANNDSGLIVKYNGNVGIGTDSPDSKLHVKGISTLEETTAGAGTQLKFVGQDNSGQFNFLIGKQYNVNNAFEITPSTVANGGVFTNPAFLVNSAGNVGIGTTSPDSKLDVKGASAAPADGNQILSITNTTGGTQLNIGTAENSYGWIEAREGATLRNLLLNPNGGNVGIGTASPDVKLEVVMPDSGGATRQDIFRLLQSGQNTLSCYMYGGTTDLVQLHVSGAEQHLSLTTGGAATATTLTGIHIRSGGNVGINTQNATGKLTVETTGNHLHIRNSAATSGQYWNFDVASQNRLYILNHVNTGVYISSGDTSWTANSDESLKENISNLQNVLPIIDNYRCVKYNLISNPEQIKIGFIAQDWQEDFPEIVNTDENNKLGIKYTETIPVLLKAIQELKAEIEILKTQINN